MDDVDDDSMDNKDVQWLMIENDDDELIYCYLDLVLVVERLSFHKNVQDQPGNMSVDDRVDGDDNVGDNVDNFVVAEYSMHVLIHNNLWLTTMMMNVG